MSAHELTVVLEVSGQIQGQIFRGLLEAQGIPVALSEEGAGTMYQLGVGPLARVQILVPIEFNAQAQQVIADYEAGKFDNERLVGQPDENSDQG